MSTSDTCVFCRIVTGDADTTLTVGSTGSVSGDNTGDVTLAGTPDYITISGQVITRNKLDPADDLNTFASSVLAGLLTDETGSGSAGATTPGLHRFCCPGCKSIPSA